jgi:hypothetical protein
MRFPINAPEEVACPLGKQNAGPSPLTALLLYLLLLVTSDRPFQMDRPKFLARQDNIAPNHWRNPLSYGTVLDQLPIRLRRACDIPYVAVTTQVI